MDARFILDSNVIIDFLAGRLPPSGMTWVADAVDRGPQVSVVSKIEVLRFPFRPDETEVIEEFFGCCSVHPLDAPVVDRTIGICRASKIKIPDAIIAATALERRMGLATRNTGDFTGIAGLSIVNPHAL
jgi:predicted nucleic acid-binding protein